MQRVKFEQIKRQKLRNFMREAKDKLIAERDPESLEESEQETYGDTKDERVRKIETENKKAVGKYKGDYVKFMNKKLTRGGQSVAEKKDTDIMDSTDLGKLPKRYKNHPQDSVEEIANNVQALIKFGRDQQKKLNELKRMQ
jgi:hypothetical protein